MFILTLLLNDTRPKIEVQHNRDTLLSRMYNDLDVLQNSGYLLLSKQ